MKKSGRLLIETVCRVVLLKRGLRLFVRKLLHSRRLPAWFAVILTRLSGLIPIDDIECFKSITAWENEIYVVTRPADHWAVGTTYWRGFGVIDAETLAVFCERTRFADTILDIGANWGYYTLQAGAINPSARIISFEPHPFWFEQLQKNVTANQFKNVWVENLAVSSNCGKRAFYLDNNNRGSSSMVSEYLKYENRTEIAVNTTSLDEYLSEKTGREQWRIDLIKLDVEIYEGAVLAGAKSILQEFKPDIICEVLPDETHTIDIRIANREAIQDILTEFGYKFYWISDHGLVKEDVIEGHFPLSNYLFTTHFDLER